MRARDVAEALVDRLTERLPHVDVSPAAPGGPSDLAVWVGRIDAQLEPAAFAGPSRPRNESGRVTLVFSAGRAGWEAREAWTRVLDAVDEVELLLARDPTLGLARVVWSHLAEVSVDAQVLDGAEGWVAVAQVTVTFMARLGGDVRE